MPAVETHCWGRLGSGSWLAIVNWFWIYLPHITEVDSGFELLPYLTLHKFYLKVTGFVVLLFFLSGYFVVLVFFSLSLTSSGQFVSLLVWMKLHLGCSMVISAYLSLFCHFFLYLCIHFHISFIISLSNSITTPYRMPLYEILSL